MNATTAACSSTMPQDLAVAHPTAFSAPNWRRFSSTKMKNVWPGDRGADDEAEQHGDAEVDRDARALRGSS